MAKSEIPEAARRSIDAVNKRFNEIGKDAEAIKGRAEADAAETVRHLGNPKANAEVDAKAAAARFGRVRRGATE